MLTWSAQKKGCLQYVHWKQTSALAAPRLVPGQPCLPCPLARHLASDRSPRIIAHETHHPKCQRHCCGTRAQSLQLHLRSCELPPERAAARALAPLPPWMQTLRWMRLPPGLPPTSLSRQVQQTHHRSSRSRASCPLVIGSHRPWATPQRSGHSAGGKQQTGEEVGTRTDKVGITSQ